MTPTYTGPTVTTCGAWGAEATSPRGTVPLLSCAALAGGSGVRTVEVKVGDEVMISGFGDGTHQTLTPIPSNLVAQSGQLFLAKVPGTTTLIVSGWFCSPTHPGGGSQPKTCPLVKIAAS